MKRIFLIALCAASLSTARAQECRTLSVDEMFALLESNNPTLCAAVSGQEAAAAGLDFAKRMRLPDIDLAVSGNYLGNVFMTDRHFHNAKGYAAPHWANNFSIQVRQDIYAGGAVTAGVRMAELQQAQAEQNAVLTRQQLRFIALGQYLDLFTLANRRKVYQSNIALTETLIDDINAKHEQGMALKNDVTRYELQLADLKLGLRRVDDLFDVKNRELCTSLGIDGVTIVPDTVFSEPVFSPEENAAAGELSWQNEALLSSPQIKLADIGASMAEQNVKIARSEALPKLSFNAVDQFTGPITFEVPIIDQNLNCWYVGLTLSWSPSSLYKYNRKVRKSKVELRRSRELQAAAEETVGNTMFDAYTAYRRSFVELDTQTKSVRLATENYDVVHERYLNQLSLITDMIDASNIRLNAELLEADARMNVVYAYYKMKFVSGTL